MSVADDLNYGTGLIGAGQSVVGVTSDQRPLHRIAEVRERQGISVRSAARRMSTSMEQIRRQEKPHCDMTLADLYRWQETLEVPVAELLVDIDAPLSEPVMARARMLRIMKTARAIQEAANSESIGRLASMLEQQLVEIMPELGDVSAWHSVGQRRTHNELGRIAERPLPDSFFSDAAG